MTVNNPLTLDAHQVRALPVHLRDQFLAWLHDVAPKVVADNAFWVAIFEGCVEVTYYLVGVDGRRFIANPHDPPDQRYPGQATWQEWACPLPPEEAVRQGLLIPPRCRQL